MTRQSAGLLTICKAPARRLRWSVRCIRVATGYSRILTPGERPVLERLRPCTAPRQCLLERAILYETCLSQCLEQGEWWSEFSCASALDLSPSACVFLCLPCPVFVRVSPLRYLSCTHKLFPSCFECGPNVSVRRIEASFRKGGNSLSGNP